MRDATNPRVQRAIVHLINHKKQDLVLSDEELTLAGNDKLRDYFSKQVKNVLGDVQTGTVRFSAEGEQGAIKEAYKIIGQPKQFVPSSQELAKSLFTAMGTDARIKPASLAVCLYKAENYSQTKFLALIKIDPTEVFVERVKTVKEKTVVTFEEIPDVLPTAREKLQKAALISPKGMDEDLDLLLLDRQVTGVAEFFAVKFLNTKPGIDPREATRRIWDVGQRTHNTLVSSDVTAKEHLTPEQADTLTQHWEVATHAEVIELEPLVDGLPFPDETKTAIRGEIEKEFPNETQIRIDPEYAKAKLTKKRRFRGDYGVLFEVESDHYDDVVLEKTERTGEKGKIITRLVIEVPGLQWVK
jgi:hypothetical protein